jgi:glyoxylase-like metal-dependent hydrolase (beta-lactamase superfamily II)
VSDLTPHPHGVTAVDAHYVRAQLDAIHVVAHRGRAAIVDSGTTLSVPHVLAALERLGLERDAVDWLFLTHVHLDHAGGAGALMRELPRAQAVLHPRGAAHLVDPSVLVAATIGVYGEAAYHRLYGEIVPIDAARIRVTHDGERLELAGRPFEFLHTPGHALHHQAIHDLEAGAVFTGDTFGISYREFDVDGRAWAIPTTTPTQFDPDQLVASIRRIAALRPAALYLTHYSRVTDVPRLADSLERQVRELAQFALAGPADAAAADAATRLRAWLRESWLTQARAHGCVLDEARVDALLGADLDLNVGGVLAWLARRRPAARAGGA